MAASPWIGRTSVIFFDTFEAVGLRERLAGFGMRACFAKAMPATLGRGFGR
jgi:hypothetical protein